jgi:hypothetical protein
MIAKAWRALPGLLVVVSGCAAGTAAKTKAEPDAAPSTMLICELERPTGTLFWKRVCRTQEIADKDRRNAEELMHRGAVQIEKGN